MTKFSISLLEKVDAEKRNKQEEKRNKILENAIPILKNYFLDKGIECLYITGSLIEKDRFHEHSDIDIAIKGLKSYLYFRSISDLEELLERRVEIIELENCRFTEKIYATALKLK